MSKRERTEQEFRDALQRIIDGKPTHEGVTEANGVYKITVGNVALEAGKSRESLNKDYTEIVDEIRKAKAKAGSKGGSRPKTKQQIRIENQEEEIKELKKDRANLATENTRYMVENEKLKKRISELKNKIKRLNRN